MTKDESTKQALGTMVFYRFYALTMEGVHEPEKIIADEIRESLRGAGVQTELISVEKNTGHKVSNSLQDCIGLLSGMQSSGKINNESMDIVIGILEALKRGSEFVLEALKGAPGHEQGKEEKA